MGAGSVITSPPGQEVVEANVTFHIRGGRVCFLKIEASEALTPEQARAISESITVGEKDV